MVPPMAPSRVVGGLANSSSSSGIFFQGDGHSQALVNSHLGSSFGNSTNLIPGTGRSSLVPVSGDMSNVAFNSVANSGPSVGASSLVTDANSALSGGPHLQRSASINGDSYMRLPTSPLSFSSNNISISGSSVMDGSSIVQQNSNQDQNTPQVHQSHQQQQQGASSASSFPASQMGQISLPNGQCGLGSFIQEPNHLSQMQKKPRLDIKQEDILQQQVMQQLLQRQDSMQLHSPNAQLQALIQQQRLRQQHQQILQSMPPIQRAHLHQQQQQQLQLRQQLQQQGMQSASASRRPFDAGVCTRRLMQYLYHQRQRPADNAIAYWRKFVAEYFSPRAKKRWCLSMYDNVGHHALGVFPQAAMDAWQCDICNSKSGRGFEATFEVLPRLNEIKFSSGVIDELLFLDLPREFRFPSGIMILEYAKAVQENVYEQLRVIREGQLRITFTPDLKILYWEFCARRHEELLPRRLVAPQVSNLVQAAQKCQSTIAESGSDGVSQQDLKTNSNMVLAAGHQLAKSLELQSLNDLGFSKRYVRCLQISEVVNSMKDLIGFCKDHNAGPIEGLKNYPRHAGAATPVQKLMALHPGLSTHMVNNPHMISGRGGALNSSAQAAMAFTNYQSLLMRQNSMNSNPNSLQPEAALSPFSHSHQSPSSSHQSMPNLTGYSSPHPQTPQQQQQQQQPPQQRSSSANSSQAMQQQQMIQQLLQGMTNNGGSCVQQQSLSGQTINGGIASRNGVAASPNMPGNGVSGGPAPSRSNSFKGPSNSDSSAAGGSTTNGFNHKIQDLPQNLQLSDELVQDIASEFTDNGFFNGDLEDTMGFGWKG